MTVKLHVRIDPDLKRRIEAATTRLTVTTDHRRQTDHPFLSEFVSIALERMVSDIEEGVPIVDCPLARNLGLSQELSFGSVTAAPRSTEHYKDMENKQARKEITRDLQLDAKRVVPGTRCQVRGNVFTEARKNRIGSTGWVVSVTNNHCLFEPDGTEDEETLIMHVYDLRPIGEGI